MSNLMGGIFLGVFIGALGYELVNRSNPEVISKIRKKVAEKVDSFLGDVGAGEFDDGEYDFNSDQETV